MRDLLKKMLGLSNAKQTLKQRMAHVIQTDREERQGITANG